MLGSTPITLAMAGAALAGTAVAAWAAMPEPQQAMSIWAAAAIGFAAALPLTGTIARRPLAARA